MNAVKPIPTPALPPDQVRGRLLEGRDSQVNGQAPRPAGAREMRFAKSRGFMGKVG
jgi:hypothetical protein